jgi:C-methyltransferase
MPEPVGPESHDQEASPRIVLDLITGKWRAQAVCVAAELGLADILRDGPRSTEEIAEIAKVSGDGVYRLLRALASLGLFASLPGRRFTLTPLGAYLRSDVPGSLRGFARFAGHDVTWRPWGDLAYSVRTGTPAFVHIFGMRSFDYYAQHPDVAAIVNDAMTAVTTTESTAITAAYDFSKIGTLVDVGGGHGLLLASILKADSGMRGILFELPYAAEGASGLFRREGLADRCAVIGGDFFDSVPEGGDVYILKKVIHDWNDERASHILRNCQRAMRPQAKLLLVERVITPGDEPDPRKFSDLEMLVLNYGRERTEAEFEELYGKAGFRLTRVVPTTSPLSIIEGVRV